MKEKRLTWSWLAVQSVLSGVLLMAVLLLRFVGGTAWDTVCALLRAWMYA